MKIFFLMRSPFFLLSLLFIGLTPKYGCLQGYVLTESNDLDYIYGQQNLGWSTVYDDATLSDWNDLPFEWDFYGTPVNKFKVSENGYIVFNPSSETVSIGENTSLSDPSAPGNAIYAFWDDFASETALSYWVLGYEGNRICKINWVSDFGGGGSAYYAIYLYESCGDFDIVTSYNFGVTGFSGSIGCKKDDGEFTEVSGSPALDFVEDRVYSFHYEDEIERDLALIQVDLPNNLIPGIHTFKSRVRNRGSQTVTSFDLFYSINGGPPQLKSVSGVALEPHDGIYLVEHDTPFIIAAGELMEIEIWVDNVNGGADQMPCNDKLEQYLVGILETGVDDRKVVLEEITYPDCGYCIDGHRIVDELTESYQDSIIPVSHHENGPMENDFSKDIIYHFKGSGYPTAMIDRTKFNFDTYNPEFTGRGSWDSFVSQRLNSWSPVDVELNVLYDPATLNVTAAVDLEYTDYCAGEGYGILLMLLADSLSNPSDPDWHQSNSYDDNPGHPLYGAGNPVEGFVYKHVLLEYIDSDLYGVQGVIPYSVEPGDHFTHTYTFELDASYSPDNITVVAAVVKKTPTNDAGYSGAVGGRQILNAESAHLISGFTSVSNNDEIELRVYPNPANNLINIEMGNEGPYQVKILDASGREILIADNSPNQIDISQLADGWYLVYVLNQDSHVLSYEKLIIKNE